tara:strand:- start:346 stop:978 length:633 start_codon:yes stop_codon:yes gene_type:complete
VKLNLENILNTLKAMGEYLFPIKKITSKFKSIRSKEDLKDFIQARSAHVTQTTLYGYLKTRMGHKFTLMVDDETFSKSINLAKWNIYMVALADCAFYVFSYLITEKNLKENDCKDTYLSILENEKKNGLSEEIYERAKSDFSKRLEVVDFKKYYLDDAFKESGIALYNWSPIADELKVLDKEIVLNSIKLKWNLVENEFKDLTKNLAFDS